MAGTRLQRTRLGEQTTAARAAYSGPRGARAASRDSHSGRAKRTPRTRTGTQARTSQAEATVTGSGVTFNGKSVVPEWAYECFPYPLTVSPHIIHCGCTWVWAPDISQSNAFPAVLKFPNRSCPLGHGRRYTTAQLVRGYK